MLSPVKSLEPSFRRVNQARLERLLQALPDKQRDLMLALPFALHGNDPLLPGYLDDPGPLGLRDFQPTGEQLAGLRRICPRFQYQPRAVPRAELHALYVMGSGGSIAFNSRSDFDIWISLAPGVPETGIRKLECRARLLENWATSLRLELHFYVLPEEKFIANPVELLAAENSGTCQRYLLLDEFYRTAILLAGLPPLWWAVPESRESDYQQYVREESAAGRLDPSEYVDFGGLGYVPAEEFLGASLWQLFKGIHSPHKAILKIVLLESYASKYPHVDLLSHDYKRNVELGVTEPDQLDPYLLMYQRIEGYLTSSHAQDELELVRRCFYLKVGEKLSRSYPSNRPHMRRRIMQGLVSAWGWGPAVLVRLDNHEHWQIDEVWQEHRSLVKKLSSSYLKLSDLTRRLDLHAMISREDMHLLGRRLGSALSGGAGKIELLRLLPLPVAENMLTIQYHPAGENQPGWRLFTGSISTTATAAPLKKFHTLTELLLWCHFNGVLGAETRVYQTDDKQRLSSKELGLLHRFLAKAFPMDLAGTTSLTEIAQAEKLTRVALLVNLGHEPFRQYLQQGAHLTSDHFDPLSFGMRQTNTIRQVDYLYMTSWGELRVATFSGRDAVPRVLQRAATDLGNTNHGGLSAPLVFGYDLSHGTAAAERVGQLLRASRKIGEEENQSHQLVFSLANQLVLAKAGPRGLEQELFADEPRLLEYLSAPVPRFRALHIDRLARLDSPLRPIMKLNQARVVQVFVASQNDLTDIYIVDEKGSLFLQSTQSYRLRTHMRHVRAFLLHLQNQTTGHTSGAIKPDLLEFYQLDRNASTGWKFRKINLGPLKKEQGIAVSVTLNHFDTRETDFQIQFGPLYWSSLEWSDAVFAQAASHIHDQRKGAEPYPIYLTRLHLPDRDRRQTVELLHYKSWLETRLSNALGMSA